MFGLIVLISILIVLGFTVAWIANIVSGEDIDTKTGVVILLLSGIASFAAQKIIGDSAPQIQGLIRPLVSFACLTVMLALIAKLSWKHSAIVASIYAGIFLVLGLVLAAAAK